jgi:hypothetical protein
MLADNHCKGEAFALAAHLERKYLVVLLSKQGEQVVANASP